MTQIPRVRGEHGRERRHGAEQSYTTYQDCPGLHAGFQKPVILSCNYTLAKGLRMDVYDFSARTIDGALQSLREFRGQALLIVNVASKCGFTPQYSGLESLYRQYRDRGFAILGFPCDQFGHQEPGDEAAIKEFCALTYDVSFPMFAKIDVNGDKAHPLYKYLKKACPGLLGLEAIKWNFTKFLVSRDGVAQKRYAPADKPENITADVATALL
jgi:glutathione peroxidase